MTDDGKDKPGDEQEPEKPERREGEIPASVAFMEMMRQAAAKSKPAPSEWANPLPSRPVVRRTSRPVEPPPPELIEDDLIELEEETVEASPVADRPSIKRIRTVTEAMEAQRVQRVKRRQNRRRRRAVGVMGGIFRSVLLVGAAAALMATIFTWWTPSGFLSNDVRQDLSVAIATSAVTLQPTSLPTPNWLRRIGIVSGHRGPENDPGAVCDDNLTESEINFNVAQLVVRNLRGRGYTVDLLDEFDPRLDGYQAAALVSIHANTCQQWPDGERVSGYLVAAAASRVSARGNDDLLVGCVARHYTSASQLQRREGVTADMTDYHTFREIHSLTPAAIIELGFMLADREVLTGQPDVLARGITDGILCFMEPGAVPTPEPPPAAEAAPEDAAPAEGAV